jgi:AraC-like DNA-binding protein/mannose-6-phosphate isomerase-like protein (cupin superfamily)
MPNSFVRLRANEFWYVSELPAQLAFAMHRTDHTMHESPGPRFLHAGSYQAPAGQHYAMHKHNCWELVYYRGGHARCPIGPQSYDATPGTVLTTPPGVPHAERSLAGYANHFIAVEAPADHPWPRITYDDTDRTLGRVFAGLAREFAEGAPDRDRMLDLLLAELDLLLCRAGEHVRPGDAERLVAQAERLLDQHHAGPVRIADIARQVGSSPAGLRAKFVAVRGRTPSEYLQSVRLRHALGLLRNSTSTLEAIATYCGYSSASHLSRQVKAATGSSPGQLR